MKAHDIHTRALSITQCDDPRLVQALAYMIVDMTLPDDKEEYIPMSSSGGVCRSCVWPDAQPHGCPRPCRAYFANMTVPLPGFVLWRFPHTRRDEVNGTPCTPISYTFPDYIERPGELVQHGE
jgi:hypothetical protein